jgi:NTE family protein
LSEPAKKPISLALQGGGAHAAFQWGVIDRLVEDGRVSIEAITGASAGAMNGVVYAAGLLKDGLEGGRTNLEAFWRGVNRAGGRNIFGDSGIWTAMMAPLDWMSGLAQAWTPPTSPYDFNPFNLNPLRDVLGEVVDFPALRKSSPIRLYVSATAVRTNASRIFREQEMTADMVMASACLPQLFQAVKVDGVDYWDGGYLANPALWPLVYDPTPRDVLIVGLNPFHRAMTPRAPAEILDRLNEITFNATLVSELRAIAFVQKLIDDGLLKEKAEGRFRRMLIHAIRADHWLDDLSLASKSDTEWSFLSDLKLRGRTAAEHWLKASFDDVGHSSSVDIHAEYLSASPVSGTTPAESTA